MVTKDFTTPSRRNSLLILLGLLVTGVQAQAHPAHAGWIGFGEGLTHPMTGLDHLVAMIAIGLWAAQIGGRATWLMPATFVSTMALGGVLAWNGVTLPSVEAGILASVIVLGLLIATAARWTMPACLALMGAFALFHGNAHGAEIPRSISPLLHGTGLVIATILLHASGVCLAMLAKRMPGGAVLRYAGGAVAAIGIGLWLA